MLEITSLDNEHMISHKRSTTLSKEGKTSLRKPRLRISFQICSIGFISGVYGGIWNRTILSGNSNPADLCHAAPSQQRRIISSLYFSDSCFKKIFMVDCKMKLDTLEKDPCRLTLGDYRQGGEWLFIQENGRQMGYSTPYSAFQDAITRYNADKPAAQQLPAIPFHGLRQYLGNPADCRETGCADSIKPAWTRTGIHEYLRPRIVGNRPQGVKCAGKYACGESAVIAEKAARSKNRTAFSAIKAGKILQ